MAINKTLDNIRNDKWAIGIIVLLAFLFFFIGKWYGTSENLVDSKGFIKNSVANFSYTLDGKIIVTTPAGKLVPPGEKSFPAKVSTLEDVSSVSIIRTTGSPVKLWIDIDNELTCLLIEVNNNGEATKILGSC